MQLLNFVRKHWLLILLIFIGIFWWHIYDLITPALLNWQLTNVDYWSIAISPNLGMFALWGFVVVGILVFVSILRTSTLGRSFILIIVSLFLCTLSTVTSRTFDFNDDRILEHVMSVTYQRAVYHLAFYNYIEIGDMGSSSYYVFECDASGNKCSKIFEEVGGREYPAKLVVLDNKLLYQWDTHSEQVLPALNGSS